MAARASKDQRLDRLSEVTIFRALSRKQLETLGGRPTRSSCRPGTQW